MNRSTRLVAGLQELGAISPDAQFVHHGRAETTSQSTQASPLLPRIPHDDLGTTAVMSPVFTCAPDSPQFGWIDLFDDWSIAPDINRLYRTYSKIFYQRLKRVHKLPATVTVNSPYMAGMLGLRQDNIVHNGVDPALASVQHTGDQRRRLIVLGHFFEGRTDLALLRSVVEAGRFDQVAICGLTPGQRIYQPMQRAVSSCASVVVEEFVAPDHLGRYIGANTVALIPNAVSDYTVSQDMMKMYTFVALGVNAICPLHLIPRTIPLEAVYAVGPGLNMARTLPDWIVGSSRLSIQDRMDFARQHSWLARATVIADRIAR